MSTKWTLYLRIPVSASPQKAGRSNPPEAHDFGRNHGIMSTKWTLYLRIPVSASPQKAGRSNPPEAHDFGRNHGIIKNRMPEQKTF